MSGRPYIWFWYMITAHVLRVEIARSPLDSSSGYIQRPHLRAIHFKPARAPITAG